MRVLTRIRELFLAQRAAPPVRSLHLLVARLERPLKPAERQLVKQLQALFPRTHGFQLITLYDLQSLFHGVPGNSWERVNWWPKPPADEIEFWRYLAHGLRERGVAIPKFLEAIDDPEATAAVIADWHRREQ